MGRRGPQPKLAIFKHLDGNPGNREIEAYGVERLGEPFIAEHLPAVARGAIEAVRNGMPARIYSASDSFLLAAFGMAWSLHQQAAMKIAAPDFEAVGERGAINRWVTVLDKATGQMLALSDRLGLDPRSRQALKLPHARQQRSKFAELAGAADGAQPSQ